jgi:ABC transporter, ATP-binding protein
LLEKTLAEVSGGERTKIALAKILLSKPDFLLLDEPTNFIDLPSVEWLEKYLMETWKGGYLIVSHDREFLDETCTSVIDMLGVDGVKEYAGSYSYSVAEKAKYRAIEEKKYDEQQVFLESEKKLINRFRAGSRASFAKSRERALEKVELIEKPKARHEIKFSFPYDKY